MSSSTTYNILSAIGRMSHAEQGIQSSPLHDPFDTRLACNCTRCSLPAPTSPLARSTTTTTTAKEELAEREAAFDEAWVQAGGGTLRSPSLGITSTTHYLGVMLNDINDRRQDLGLSPYSPSVNLPSPPSIQRVSSYSSAPLNLFQTFVPTDENDLMDRIRTYRSELQLQQDDLYKGVESEKEILALDEKYNELSDKIRALEHVMLTFGAIFRNR